MAEIEKIAKNLDRECQVWCIQADDPDNVLLRSRKVAAGAFHRGVIEFQGLVAYESIKIEDLMRDHCSKFSFSVDQVSRPSSMMVDSTVDAHIPLCEGGTLVLQITRSSAGRVPLQSFLTDNTIYDGLKLHQSVIIGDLDSPAMQFWHQLQMLDNLKDIIVRYKESGEPSDLVYTLTCDR